MELRIREVDEGGGGLTETRASEAKGPFPGGKRVGRHLIKVVADI
jgi:hypothetical protein